MTSDAPVPPIDRPAHHRLGGGFRNPPGSPKQKAKLQDFIKFLLVDMRRATLPPIPADIATQRPLNLAELPDNHVAWLGHACFAIKIAGNLVLTDPYLSRTAGPFGFGPQRFLHPAVRSADLPRFDAIVISHNHYDHLDSKALRAYRWRNETPMICPLGNGALLSRLGFTEVHELDWWQNWSQAGLTIGALPAVHFSGRGLLDRNRSLWASVSIAAGERRIWFGGDTAAGAVFDEIGDRAGPFDLALVGIGAYEPRIIMEASHATPEEAITIARQIRARHAVGMHWGSIMLTPENPFEAPARFRKAALEQQYGASNAWILQVGEARGF